MTLTVRALGGSATLPCPTEPDPLGSLTFGGWRFSLPERRRDEMGRAFSSFTSGKWHHELLVGYVAGPHERARALADALVARVAARPGLSPRERLADCRSFVTPQLDAEMFCSAWCGVFRDDGTVVCSSAGHRPPFLRRRGARSLALEPGGVPFGLPQSAISPERTLRMRDGDDLLVLADGLSAGFESEREDPEDAIAVWVERRPALPLFAV